MPEIIKKYWLAGVILVVAIAGLVVLWLTGPKTSNQGAQPTPTVIQTKPTPTIPVVVGYGPFAPGESTDQITKNVQQLAQNKKDYPLASLLPYTTSLFTIDHYRSPRLLVVIVKSAADEKVATDGVGKWLVEKGLAANSHQIVWQIGNQ